MTQHTHWNKETLLETIRTYHQDNRDLSYTGIQRSMPTLLRAAVRLFGSWQQAVSAAGIPYEQVQRYTGWSRDRIIARIQELHRQGVDLSWRHISQEVAPSLAAAATKPRYFGSWRKAIEASGIDYRSVSRYRRWDEAAIIERLREMYERGEPLNAASVERDDMSLITAARRRFDSWDNALLAAGLDYKQLVLRRPAKRGRRSA